MTAKALVFQEEFERFIIDILLFCAITKYVLFCSIYWNMQKNKCFNKANQGNSPHLRVYIDFQLEGYLDHQKDYGGVALKESLYIVYRTINVRKIP